MSYVHDCYLSELIKLKLQLHRDMIPESTGPGRSSIQAHFKMSQLFGTVRMIWSNAVTYLVSERLNTFEVNLIECNQIDCSGAVHPGSHSSPKHIWLKTVNMQVIYRLAVNHGGTYLTREAIKALALQHHTKQMEITSSLELTASWDVPNLRTNESLRGALC